MRSSHSVLVPIGVGIGLGALFIALSHSSSASAAPSPKLGPSPAPKKASAPKTTPGPKPPPTPVPEPPPPAPQPSYVYPTGSVVRANVASTQRGEGLKLVKIINNVPSAHGDYEVIDSKCFLPDALCSSEWIRQEDIVD
jgi:hypothetical protein